MLTASMRTNLDFGHTPIVHRATQLLGSRKEYTVPYIILLSLSQSICGCARLVHVVPTHGVTASESFVKTAVWAALKICSEINHIVRARIATHAHPIRMQGTAVHALHSSIEVVCQLYLVLEFEQGRQPYFFIERHSSKVHCACAAVARKSLFGRRPLDAKK